MKAKAPWEIWGDQDPLPCKVFGRSSEWEVKPNNFCFNSGTFKFNYCVFGQKNVPDSFNDPACLPALSVGKIPVPIITLPALSLLKKNNTNIHGGSLNLSAKDLNKPWDWRPIFSSSGILLML